MTYQKPGAIFSNLEVVNWDSLTESELSDAYVVVMKAGETKLIKLVDMFNKYSVRHHRDVLVSTVVGNGGVSDQAICTQVITQGTGTYAIFCELEFADAQSAAVCNACIKQGATYSTAPYLSKMSSKAPGADVAGHISFFTMADLTQGETVHLGAEVIGSGNCSVYGNDSGLTSVTTLGLLRLDDHFGYW